MKKKKWKYFRDESKQLAKTEASDVKSAWILYDSGWPKYPESFVYF